MLKPLLCFAFCLLLLGRLHGQSTYNQIAKDTIIQVPGFLGTMYLLDGKKLNLSVMDWFMTDYPEARDKIRVAVLTDQVSIVGYTFGGLFCLTGLLFHREDPELGNSLLKMGAAGIGAGITFQVISSSFQKKAVRYYNQEIQSIYKSHTGAVNLKISSQSLGVEIKFN